MWHPCTSCHPPCGMGVTRVPQRLVARSSPPGWEVAGSRAGRSGTQGGRGARKELVSGSIKHLVPIIIMH